jgi:D-alanyl-D-alanine carboxypeptidase
VSNKPSYTQSELQEIDKTLTEDISQNSLPGVVMGITSDESTLFTIAIGVRVLGQPEKLIETDLLHIGSNGKAMTATMVAVLVERGLLSWDSTPADIYSEIKAEISPEFRSVTLRQLLCHSAGILGFTDEQEFKDIPELRGDLIQQRLEFTKWILAQKPVYEPGTFHYSNAGYVIAASMAETVTHKSWELLMNELLFQPLGIEARFGWPAENISGQPWGHTEVDGKLRPISPEEYLIPEWLSPTGNVSVSVPDYLKFLRCHLQGLKGRSPLLSKETFTLLHKVSEAEGPAGVGVACGWGIKELNGITCHVHSGSGGTFFACAALAPEMDFGAAVVCNAGNAAAEEVCAKLLKTLLAKHMDKIKALK